MSGAARGRALTSHCPKCHSTRLAAGVRVAERSPSNLTGLLSLEVDERPEALVFKKTHRYPLTATVCGDCGFTELYINDPAGLMSAREAGQQAGGAGGTGG
jgi:predicted nucleic-acid-binding Zn-ribbon protein